MMLSDGNKEREYQAGAEVPEGFSMEQHMGENRKKPKLPHPNEHGTMQAKSGGRVFLWLDPLVKTKIRRH